MLKNFRFEGRGTVYVRARAYTGFITGPFSLPPPPHAKPPMLRIYSYTHTHMHTHTHTHSHALTNGYTHIHINVHTYIYYTNICL